MEIHEKQCVRCAEINPPDANFCSLCGGDMFQDVSPGQTPVLRQPGMAPFDPAVRLSFSRVALLTAASFGFYQYWWFYVTWKQLAPVTMAGHRPVWHALAMLVPIYNLFRIHKHIAVIKELSGSPTLSPRLVVALTIGITALGLASLGIDNAAILFVIALTGLAVTAFIVGWAQSALNQYWRARMGAGLQNAPIGTGELALVSLGILLWLLQLLLLFTPE